MAVTVRMRLQVPPTPLFRQAVRPLLAAALRPRLLRVQLLWERSAKLLTPVDTGLLRASLRGEVEGGLGAAGGSLAVVLGSHVVYAGYVEYGTRSMRGRHMVGRALAQIRPQVTAEVEGGLRDLARRLGGR